MTDERQTGAGTTGAGFAVLWVAIKREPWIFTVSTIGSLLFGALTVADAWVLGWSTDHVVLPAFRDGEILGASCNGQKDVEAVYAFLAWESGRFQFTPGPVAGGVPLGGGFTQLVLDGCRRLDESRKREA